MVFEIRMYKYHLAVVACSLMCFACCGKSTSSCASSNKLAFAGIKLKLAVADDSEFAAAAIRLQGEWNAQTGAEYQVLQISGKELVDSKTLAADAVICAPRFIGPLAEKKLIAAVPNAIQKTAQWSDVFDLTRLQELAWGKEVMAVPFGSPVFVIYYRADLLEKLNRGPPRSWSEYQALVDLLSKAEFSSGKKS
ncbi:MAG: hypothetical protein ACWGMZ_06485, partial [Thermoguttaceae bacterium]